MDIWKALLMGVIQGFTEFLPISSSGHLAIFTHLTGMEIEESMYFDILLHLGTLIAICLVFYKEVWNLVKSFGLIVADCFTNLRIWIKRRRGGDDAYVRVLSNGYRKMVALILVSTIPTGILGFAGKEIVNWATQTLWLIGVCLFLTSILLLLADLRDQGTITLKKTKFSHAFFIGIGQGLATMPGLSRSGTTIALAMMMGWEKKTAVKYSFLMSLPAVLGAVILDLKDIGTEKVASSDLGCYIAGTVAALVTGYIALRWMLFWVRNRKYRGFAVYCGVMGLIAILLNFFGR